MLVVNVDFGCYVNNIFMTRTACTTNEIWNEVERITGLSRSNFYATHNNCLITNEDFLHNGTVTFHPRLFGGKGGFGSMLRAIGAQIEKTTNREACRDLSGRRLRDINEEKRLKAWIEKQNKREEEAAERKKKKLDKLCAMPKHEFKDEHYDHERSTLVEKISDAVEEGFKALDSKTSCGGKRQSEHEPEVPKKKKKIFLEEDADIDLDEISDSDSSSDECSHNSMEKIQTTELSNASNQSNTSTVEGENDLEGSLIKERNSETCCLDRKENVSSKQAQGINKGFEESKDHENNESNK